MDQHFSLLDLFKAVYQYKFRFVFVSLLCLVAGVGLVLLLPKMYESEAKLFVRLGRSSTSVDPATIGQTISIQESRETEINSLVDLLQSRGLLESIVEDIGEEVILRKYAWLEIQMEKAMSFINYDSDQLPNGVDANRVQTAITKQRESAIRELASNLKVISPKKSTTISVIVRARDPELAQMICERLVTKFQRMHVTATKSEGSLSFFDQQFAEQERVLRESEQRYQEVKNQAQMLTLAGKQGSLQAEYDNVKLMQMQTQAELAAARSRADDLKQAMTKLPETLDSQTTRGIEFSANGSMRDRLYALEIQEKELASKYKDNHPDLKKVRAQLLEAREINSAQPKETEQTIVAVNPVLLDMQKELLVTNANIASLTTKMTELNSMEQNLAERISQVNSLQVEADQLQRKIRIAEENYGSYAKKLEESRIKAAMDRETLSNLSLVAAPTVRLKHVSPNRPLLAILCAILAGMAGTFVAVLSYSSKRVREVARMIQGREQIRSDRPTSTPATVGRTSTEMEEELLATGQSRPR